MEKGSNYINKLFNLDNQIVVLTGGMGKLGINYAEALVKANGRVAIYDIISSPDKKLSALAKRYPLLFLKVDITKENEVKKAFDYVEKKWGIPTILINNAGWTASPHEKIKASVPAEIYPVKVWDEVFSINTTSTMICSKIAAQRMIKKKKKGIIINIASTYALVSPNQKIYKYKAKKGQKFVKDASYSASKAAIVALTRDFAVQWAPYGIRVVCFSPGGVISEKSDPEFIKAYSEKTPLGRMANPNEYNAAIIFLASNASSYMTGTNLIIDGGWTSW